MMMLMPVLWAVVLVVLGYGTLLTTYHGSIPKPVAQFGKILSTVLFVLAGLVIVMGAVGGPCGVRGEPAGKACASPSAHLQAGCSRDQRRGGPDMMATGMPGDAQQPHLQNPPCTAGGPEPQEQK